MTRRYFITFCSCIVMTHSTASGQRRTKPVVDGPRYNTGIYHPRQPKRPPAYQIAYIGIGGGINNPCGYLGPQLDLTFSQHVSVCGGVGFSTWGTKSGLEARYYFSPANRRLAVSTGLTYNSGRTNVLLDNIETNLGELPITVDMQPQFCASLAVAYLFNLGRRGANRFQLQTGYSIPLSEPGFGYGYSGSRPLTDRGRRTVLSLAPGGLILGLGMSFGTGKAREHKRQVTKK